MRRGNLACAQSFVVRARASYSRGRGSTWARSIWYTPVTSTVSSETNRSRNPRTPLRSVSFAF